jgi:hypothetical protein
MLSSQIQIEFDVAARQTPGSISKEKRVHAACTWTTHNSQRCFLRVSACDDISRTLSTSTITAFCSSKLCKIIRELDYWNSSWSTSRWAQSKTTNERRVGWYYGIAARSWDSYNLMCGLRTLSWWRGGTRMSWCGTVQWRLSGEHFWSRSVFPCCCAPAYQV